MLAGWWLLPTAYCFALLCFCWGPAKPRSGVKKELRWWCVLGEGHETWTGLGWAGLPWNRIDGLACFFQERDQILLKENPFYN
jgi:hypothetical protein